MAPAAEVLQALATVAIVGFCLSLVVSVFFTMVTR